MLKLLLTTSASLLGWLSEAQVILLVLVVLVVTVALLSYFVIAPEYEKHFEKQFASMLQETSTNSLQHQHQHTKGNKTPTQRSLSKQRLLSMTPKDDETRKTALDPQDMEAAFSDDDASSTDSEPMDASRRFSKSTQSDLSRRRKSESDALKKETINKAEMLRRRVLLRKLEEEIDGAIQETNAKAAGMTPRKQRSLRLIRRDSLGLSEDRVQQLQEMSVDCVSELEVLAKSTNTDDIKQALRTVHDVLALYLSNEHRDMNKVTVFCNSLLKHDGLNHLRGLEMSSDGEVRGLANQIIEKAVPAIWH